MNKDKLIGYVGLSHLSMSYSLASVKRGYQVAIFDFDNKLMNKFSNLELDFNESDLLKKFKSLKSSYYLSNDIKNLKKCNLIFISLDVKTDAKNISNYSKIKKYIYFLHKKINKKIPFVIQSQLIPGFCNNLKINDREIYYQVETLIFGKAFKRALNPDRIIVGYNKDKNERFNKFYSDYLSKFKCQVIRMDYLSAEISKIAINIFLSSSVTLANILSRLSEKIGGNYKFIEKALRSDERIGLNSYLNPGLGISGGNLERDLTSLQNILEKNDINSDFIHSIIKNSNLSKNWISEVFLKIYRQNKIKNISLIGLSYKKNNSSLKNSPSILFLKKIKKLRINIDIYDDLIKNYDGQDVSKIENTTQNPELVIFARDFRNFDLIVKKFFYNKTKLKYCIDPFNLVKDKYILKSKVKVFQVGKK